MEYGQFSKLLPGCSKLDAAAKTADFEKEPNRFPVHETIPILSAFSAMPLEPQCDADVAHRRCSGALECRATRTTRYSTTHHSPAAQIPVRALEPRSRTLAIAPRQLRDKADCSLAQFFVRRLKIDHQISAHPPQPSHCACADDIQRDFCRRPCFQARGAGNDFRAGQKIDHKVQIFCRGRRAGCYVSAGDTPPL